MLYDTADLVARCQFYAGRPASDQSMTPERWYLLLTDAQQHWTNVIATKYPQIMYGAPVQLETDDGGYTYRLPLDGELEVFPIGLAELRDRRNGRLLTIGPEFGNYDFTPEGTKLRVPHGKTRTFPDGPYLRYVTPAGQINADTEPTLKPTFARILLVFHACYLWASRPPHAADPGFFLSLQQHAWSGDPNVEGDYGIEGVLATQFFNQDGDIESDAGSWWDNPDFS